MKQLTKSTLHTLLVALLITAFAGPASAHERNDGVSAIVAAICLTSEEDEFVQSLVGRGAYCQTLFDTWSRINPSLTCEVSPDGGTLTNPYDPNMFGHHGNPVDGLPSHRHNCTVNCDYWSDGMDKGLLTMNMQYFEKTTQIPTDRFRNCR